MTQSQVNRAVASATGESRRTIRRLGFSLVDPIDGPIDPEPSDIVKFLDWDEVAGQRYSQLAVY